MLLGSAEVDAVFTILLTTDVFVGALVGFIFDNTIPGNLKKKKSHAQIKAISQYFDQN